MKKESSAASIGGWYRISGIGAGALTRRSTPPVGTRA